MVSPACRCCARTCTTSASSDRRRTTLRGSEVFGTSFTYGRQWLSPDGHDWALEFKADIADTGRSIDGIDLVKLDEAGRMIEFTVLARPPNGVDALKREMMKRVPPRLAALKMRKLFS